MDLSSIARQCGVDSLRPFQVAALETVAAGRDAFISVATGGGKSLCFIAAAFMLDSEVLVVSPLKSLMADQMAWCAARGIEAVKLGDMVPVGPCVVFTTPEAIAAGRLDDMPSAPRAIAVDEAHLIAAWGFSFRSSYTELGALRARWPDAAIMALTATVSRDVQGDVSRILRLRDPVVIAGAPVRANLAFSVVETASADAARREATRVALESGKSIVYCRTKKLCDRLAEDLRRAGHDAAAYHADLSDELRGDTLARFSSQPMIVVATVAFGLGVSVPDVRAVVNLGTPDTPEALWQQAGRAGRDGLPAKCVLVTFPSDMNGGRDGMAAGSMTDDRSQTQALLAVARMRNYLQGQTCRQLFLTEGFLSDGSVDAACQACDVCVNGPRVVDQPAATQEDAERVALVLSRTGGLGSKNLLDLLCRAKNKKVDGMHRHLGPDWSTTRTVWESAIHVAAGRGIIAKKCVKLRNGFSVAIYVAST